MKKREIERGGTDREREPRRVRESENDKVKEIKKGGNEEGTRERKEDEDVNQIIIKCRAWHRISDTNSAHGTYGH